MDLSAASHNVFEALRTRWWLVVLVTLIGAGAGVAYGLQRDPIYTAETRLSVGRVDLGTQSIPGFATAALQLADTYSRAIVADRVVEEIAKRTRLRKQEVLDNVTAAPIPETATIRVIAEADKAKTAVSGANTAAAALVDYVRKLNRSNPDSQEFLRKHTNAAKVLGEAKERLRLQGSSPERQAAVESAKLELRVLAGLYGQSQAGRGSPNTLQLLAEAAGADSDQSSFVQRAGFAGGVVGLLVGSLLAVALHRRRHPG